MYKPSVGDECWISAEALKKGAQDITDEFEKCIVKYISDEGVVCIIDECEYFIDCQLFEIKFKQFKSKRDEEIDLMMDCSSVSNYSTCSALYDLGYRKQLPYSQFVSIIQRYLYNDLGYSENGSQRHAQELSARLNRTPEETL